MATWNGPAQNGGRIEYTYTVGAVSRNTTSVTVSVTAYLRMLDNNRSVGSWPQSWSGAWGSGSSTPYRDIARNGRVEIRSWSGSVSLTDSTQTRSFQISAGHNFGTTSATLSVTIPARYARTPTNLGVNRVSDSRIDLAWTRQGTYTQTQVQFRHNTGSGWGDWASAGTATGNVSVFQKTSGIYANRAYQFRVRSSNGHHWSEYTGASAVIYTTPNAPSTVTASRSGSNIVVGVSGLPPHVQSFDIEREGSGIVGSAIAKASMPWTDTGAGTARRRYRVRARQNSGGNNSSVLLSSWSSWSNYSQVIQAPSNVSPTRNSDSQITVSWTRNSTYTSVTVQRQTDGGSWATVGTAQGNASSFTDTSVQANRQYRYRVQGNDDEGSSGVSAVSGYVYTTPAAPTGVSATRVGDNIRISVSGLPPYATHFDVYDEATSSIVGSIVPRDSLPWTHVSPNPAVPHRYRVRARVASGGSSSTTLLGAYSGWSNNVQLQSPPNAPQVLGPTGPVVRGEPSEISWAHNPVDASEQTAYQVQYRLGSGAWSTISGTTFSSVPFTPPSVGTYSIQVRTKGSHPDWSPWSTSRVVQAVNRPSVAINEPGNLYNSATLTAEWSYSSDASGAFQYGWEAQLLNLDTQTVLETLSGTATSTGLASATFSRRLDADTNYQVRVRANYLSTVWSPWAEQSFLTVFIAPAEPIVEAVWNDEEGSHDLTVDSSVGPEREDVVNLFTNPRLKGDDTWVEMRRNLVASAPGRYVSIRTDNVPFDGDYWYQFEGTGTRGGSRINIPLESLEDGETYTVSAEIANPGTEPIDILIQWCDTEISSYTIEPGERRLIHSSGAREEYTDVFRFADIRPRFIDDGLILLRTVTIEKGEAYSSPFNGETMYDSMGRTEDFRVRWLGAPYESESVMESYGTWVEVRRNLVTNPRMEASSGAVEVRRNLLAPPPNPILATRTDDVLFDGDLWYQLDATGVRGGVRALTDLSNLTDGAPYTAVAEVANPNSVPIELRIDWCNVDLTTRYTLAPGERRIIRTVASAREEYTNTYRFVDVRPEVATPPGPFLVRKVTLVAGEYSGDPFDGDTELDPAEGLTARWVGTPNASESVLEVQRVADLDAGSANYTSEPYQITLPDGSKAARFITGTLSTSGMPVSNVITPVGTTRTVLFQVRPSVDISVRPRVGNDQRTYYETLPAGQWTTLRHTGTAVFFSASQTGLTIRDNIPGTVVDIRYVLFTEGEYDGPYFDGSTTPETAVDVVQPEDFRWFWTGAENASESVMEIEQVRGVQTVDAIAGVSTRDGKPALRIIPNNPSTSVSLARVYIPADARGGGTAYATNHQDGPISGILWERRGMPYALNPVLFTPTPAPNAAGSWDHRVKFPELTSGYYWVMPHGGRPGSGDVWWTDIGLFAGDYDGPHFDGSSGQLRIDGTIMSAVWDGEPDNSPSRLTTAEPTVRTAIERSVDGGISWEPVYDMPYTDGDVISLSDYEGLSCGETLYRATGTADTGASAVTEFLALSDSDAIWLGTGSTYAQTARLGAHEGVQIARSRERVGQRFAGRSLPVAYSSAALSRTLSVTGVVPDSCLGRCMSATRDELDDVILHPFPVVLYRDMHGNRIWALAHEVTGDRLWIAQHRPCGDHAGMCRNGLWTFALSLEEAERV